MSVWVLPVVGARISQLFGQLPGQPWGDCAPGGHPGTDYAVPAGTPVYAASDGVVSYAGEAEGFGPNAVSIYHPADDVTSTYGHMMHRYVQTALSFGGAMPDAQAQVLAGQLIGLADTMGTATGPHLHFEIRPGRATFAPYPPNIDPDRWLHDHGAYSAPHPAVEMAAIPTCNTNGPLNMAHPTVRTLQGLLEARGGMIKPDNTDHPVFTENVRWFQQQAGLVIDGDVGPVTAARLVLPLNGK